MDFQFSDDERRIFSYHDGISPQFGDPIDLQRRIDFTLPKAHELIAKINTARPVTGQDWQSLSEDLIRDACIASEALTRGIRQVFELPELDRSTGKGCTEAMVLAVWNRFCAFQLEKKNQPVS